MALVEMSVVEQRYRAVLAVGRGEPKIVVAAQFGVSRQTLHPWLTRYARDGLAGLIDRTHRPPPCAHQACAEVEIMVCELRREHPRWGPRRIAFELVRTAAESTPVVSRSTVYRILVRHGCHRKIVAGVTIRCLRQNGDSNRVRAANTARSAQDSRGLRTWRRNTATSWRSTRISAFFDCALRASSPSQATSCRKIRYNSRTAMTDDHA
jgi:transposase